MQDIFDDKKWLMVGCSNMPGRFISFTNCIIFNRLRPPVNSIFSKLSGNCKLSNESV